MTNDLIMILLRIGIERRMSAMFSHVRLREDCQ